ncbi:MAG: DUF4296 domain-containing protein [Bacteroidota bacterium]
MKLRVYILIGLSIGAFNSCNYELSNETPPQDLIPKDSFKMVLKDMMFAESAIKNEFNNVNIFYKRMPEIADSIFNKYAIDSNRYRRSMDYYTTDQDELIEMYESIQDEIVLESAEHKDED